VNPVKRPITVGVVITIPEPHASVLASWRREVGDHLGAVIPPHVTLLPPTRVEHDDLPAVRTHLEKAAESGGPFPMHLLGTGTFRPMSPVVFVTVARGIADCELLEQSIRSGPLSRELEFTYHPHVTVAQDVTDEQLDAAYDGLANFVARFQVEHFSLFEQAEDGSWTGQEDYRLGVS
jgi:2'-5' RNA ligase